MVEGDDFNPFAQRLKLGGMPPALTTLVECK